MNKIGVGFLLWSLFGWQNAYAWGQYGHEQVNSAAIDLLASQSSAAPLAQCLRTAKETMVRYSITPDMEWKTDQFLKDLTAAEQSARREDNCYEHELHFFETDAFVTANGKFPPQALSAKYSETNPT